MFMYQQDFEKSSISGRQKSKQSCVLILHFTPFPFINTTRLCLRNVVADDAPQIFFLRSDETVMKFLDRAPAASVEEAEKFIENITNLEKTGEAITWAITLKEDAKLIGTIGYWRIEKEHYRAEIGYVLHPHHHNKGIMQEALKAVLDVGFHILKLHSVEANVNPHNAASIKLLEHTGFVREGYFKENYFYDGRFLDSAVYSLLAPANSIV